MFKRFKYRIYPNKAQREMFAKHFGCVRFIYNWGLEQKIKSYQKDKKRLSYFDLANQLPVLKQEFSWLKEVSGQSLQMALRNLDVAFTRFFKKQNGFPKFKNKHQSRQSFQCPQFITIDYAKLNIPKIKNIKVKLDRDLIGKIKMTTIIKTSTNKYFVSMVVDDGKELPKKVKATIEKSVGVDLGLTHFATLSTGEKIPNPRYFQKSLKKLRRQQRRLARRKKDSSNRAKQKIHVAKVHEKVTNQRKDFLHKLSKRLIDENQAVCLEGLDVNDLLKNSQLAKYITNVGWRTFRSFCEYKADWYGKEVRVIGRFEPSSKICSCGTINHNLQLSDREWTCDTCGITHDRDILAAQNILRFAFIRRGSPKSTPVESAAKSA